MSASRRSGATDELGPEGPEPEREGPGGSDLLAALLDGMDAALCAFDADGVVTHWNREAERILGWTAEEAVGRAGFAGWAVRSADAEEVEARLMSAMDAPGRAGQRVRAAHQGRPPGPGTHPVRRRTRS